jgi:D-aminopeptidase
MTRLRDLGLSVGSLPTGPDNAITDVAGVLVGHTTVIEGDDVRTGVTVVRPRTDVRARPCFAGTAALNGNGDLIGTDWVRESGLLTSPIGLTNTHSVGVVRDALVGLDDSGSGFWSMPVVGETYDGILNDVRGQHVTTEHVVQAFTGATGGAVAEGGVGGGTGMICHELKGGIGSSSRLVALDDETFTVGVLVQANYGRREDLRVDGWPVGRVLGTDRIPTPVRPGLPAGSGSIIIVVATDAPLLGDQCRRLALRGFVGLARTGGGCSDSSGDLAIAFSTADQGIPPETYPSSVTTHALRSVPHQHLTPFFQAAAEATEEAILAALLAGRTMTGKNGATAHGLEPDVLLAALAELRAA